MTTNTEEKKPCSMWCDGMHCAYTLDFKARCSITACMLIVSDQESDEYERRKNNYI